MATKKPAPYVTRPAPNLDWAAADDFLASLAPVAVAKEPETRNPLAVANDWVIEGVNAMAGGVGSVANAISPGNRLSQFIDEQIIKDGESKQSDMVKGEKARFSQEVADAEGFGEEAAAALAYAARNPGLAAAQAVGSFVLPGAAVKGARALAGAAGAGAAGAARAGLAGGAAAGASMAGGDAAGQAYELAIQAGATEEEAVAAARRASVLPAIAGGAGGLVGAERLVAGARGFGGSAVSRALKTGTVEGLQESAEEALTTFEGRRAAQPFDPNIDPTKGMGAAAGLGFALGGVTGAGISAITPQAEPELTPSPADQIRATKMVETGALTKSINAGIEAQAVAVETTPEAAKPLDSFSFPSAELAAEFAARFNPGYVPAQKADGSWSFVEGEPLATQAPEGSAEEVASSFAERLSALKEDLANPESMAAVREAHGREGAQDLLQVISAVEAGTLPARTAEKMLAGAERRLASARMSVVPTEPAVEQQPAMEAPAELPAIEMAPPPLAVEFDESPSGTIIANEDGDARLETRAEAISLRQEQGRRADLGLTPDVERASMRAALGNQTKDGDILTAGGFPFRNRRAAQAAAARAGAGFAPVEIAPDSFVVRPAAQAQEEQVADVPQLDQAAREAAPPPAAQAAEIRTEAGQPFKSKAVANRQAKLNPGYAVEEVEGGWILRKSPAAELAGEAIDKKWTAFAADSGTLAIPRAEMPQIKAVHRGAMVNFLAARGIKHEQAEVPAADLKPTQAEFSPSKVKAAKDFDSDRSILVSSDGHVLDGHHQWMSKLEAGEAVKVIRLDAPIAKLLEEVKEFPSAQAADGATTAEEKLEAETLMKRSPEPGQGIKAEDLKEQLAKVIASWKNGPAGGVTIVQSVADLPGAIRDGLKAVDAEGTVRALFRPNSQAVFVIADNVGSVEEAQFALLHEVYGHLGLRSLLGRDYADTMIAIRRANKRLAVEAEAWFLQNGMAEIRERMGRGMKAPDAQRQVALLAVEEALADRAGRNEPISSWRWLAAKIQKALRAAGLNHVADWMENKTQAEVMDLLRQARAAVQGRGVAPAPSGEPEMAMSRDEMPVLSRAKEGGAAFDVKGKPEGVLKHYRGMAMQFLGRRQIVDLFKGDIPALAEYDKLVQRMDAEKNDTGAEADQLATRWAKLPDEIKLADLMHDATLAQIDPSKDYVQGDDKAKWRSLRSDYNALSPEAKKVLGEARDFYSAHFEKVQQALEDRLVRTKMTEKARNRLLEQMRETFTERTKGFYAPLARFGDYVILVRDSHGKIIGVSRAETVNQAEATRERLRRDYPSAKGYQVGKVLKDPSFNAAFDSPGPGFMKDLFAVIEEQGADEALTDAVGQLYLASLPDLSWAKHGIHRKGTPGFSSDARRAFAQSAFHGARYLAKLRYADQLQSSLEDMKQQVDDGKEVDGVDSVKAQQVVDEMKARHATLMNPQTHPLSTALTSIGFVFHLGASPASAMVNLLQTPLVALPQMGAKWGFAKASAALARASKEAAANVNDISKVLTGDELRAYNEAVRAGVIDVTQAHDLAGLAQGEDSAVQWKMRTVMKWAGLLFHHAERYNRQTTFVAAYRLARGAGTDHAAAVDQATRATYDGHFDYSSSNRPRIMQGDWARVILLFQQFAQNALFTIGRAAYQATKGLSPAERSEARKALAGIMVTHAAAAGGLGLPFVSTILAIASMLGSTDDEPWDAEIALRNTLADTFGQEAGEIMARGISRATPWDISGRVALNQLILPDVQEGLEGQRLAESALFAAAGPVAGIGANILKGLQTIGEGHHLRGLEEMMPSAIRSALRAIRFVNEGGALDKKTGIEIAGDLGAAEIAGQALGLAPSSVRRAQEAKSAVYQADKALQDRRTALKRTYTMAMEAGDQEAVADARKAIAGFNEKNPGRRITSQQLAASMRERRRRRAQAENGMYLPASRRDALVAGRFAKPEEEEGE
ncbi:PLxRFG domain-containing protein [Paucibacter sp. O1-1]|nr:PLxRFG domain-containing protein [Paucibacter sp. O1-1]MDA3827865.1 PLxRFG domain-containing protein [Paucibacter sp. O1-1]